MRTTRRWLRVALTTMVSAPVVSAQTTSPAAVFRPIFAELRAGVRIPVLLPSKLPAVLHSAQIRDVSVAIDAEDSYGVELWYDRGVGNAGFAASFGAEKAVPGRARPKNPIRLANGALARFMPVSCGGSCAPANLWWQQGNVVYHVAMRLRFDMDPRAQAQALVETANAMVRLRGANAIPRQRANGSASGGVK